MRHLILNCTNKVYLTLVEESVALKCTPLFLLREIVVFIVTRYFDGPDMRSTFVNCYDNGLFTENNEPREIPLITLISQIRSSLITLRIVINRGVHLVIEVVLNSLRPCSLGSCKVSD